MLLNVLNLRIPLKMTSEELKQAFFLMMLNHCMQKQQHFNIHQKTSGIILYHNDKQCRFQGTTLNGSKKLHLGLTMIEDMLVIYFVFVFNWKYIFCTY